MSEATDGPTKGQQLWPVGQLVYVERVVWTHPQMSFWPVESQVCHRGLSRPIPRCLITCWPQSLPRALSMAHTLQQSTNFPAL